MEALSDAVCQAAQWLKSSSMHSGEQAFAVCNTMSALDAKNMLGKENWTDLDKHCERRFSPSRLFWNSIRL